jgi:hypothetical protein
MKHLPLLILMMIVCLPLIAQVTDVSDSVNLSGKQTAQNARRYKAQDKFAFMFSSGIYVPIGTKNVFAAGPVFSILFSSPIAETLSFDLVWRVRTYRDSKQFVYRSKGNDTVVISNTALFMGASLNRRVYKHQFNSIHMRFGLGVDVIVTDFQQPHTPSPNDPDTERPFDVSTVHGSYGFSAMHQFKNGKHIGIVSEFHIVPYGLSSRLKTAVDICALSGELFVRL